MGTISIWGRYLDNEPEKVDSAHSQNSAEYLAAEYKLAFGRDWKVWAGRKDQEPKDEPKSNNPCF